VFNGRRFEMMTGTSTRCPSVGHSMALLGSADRLWVYNLFGLTSYDGIRWNTHLRYKSRCSSQKVNLLMWMVSFFIILGWIGYARLSRNKRR
jgi:hypothetical protein